MTDNEQNEKSTGVIAPDALSDYRSKVGEIIRSENQRFVQLAEEQASSIIEKACQKADAIVQEGQEKVIRIIGEGQKKAADFLSTSQRQAMEAGKKIEEEARQRAEAIIEEARQRCVQIEQDAEEEAARQARARIKAQEEKMLAKTREDVQAILDEARVNAEREANGIIEKTKEEAGQLVEDLTERYRKEAGDRAARIEKEAEDRAARIRNEALQRANRLIDDMTRQQDEARAAIAGTLKKSETLLERVNAEMQAEMEILHGDIIKAREKLEATRNSFDFSEEEEPDFLSASGLESQTLWLSLNGTRSGEDESSCRFQGQMKLKALSSTDQAQLRDLKSYLSGVSGMRFTGESSGEEGTVCSYDVSQPLPLMDILNNAPLVGRVVMQGDSVKISLG